MRTIDDIHETVKKYQEALNAEQNSPKTHYVVVGGGICICQKPNTFHYELCKGEPVPMLYSTAERHKQKYDEKLTDDIQLQIILYSDWLKKNIDECSKLEKMGSQEPVPENSPMEVPETPVPENIQKKIKVNKKNMIKSPENSPMETPETTPKKLQKNTPETMKTPDTNKTPEPVQKPVQGNTLPTVPRPITSICESCPIEIQKCWACRFCMGIDTSGLEWTVNCAYTKK